MEELVVVPKEAEDQVLQVRSDDTSEDICKQINRFREQREKKKRQKFLRVVTWGWGMLLLGMVGYCSDLCIFYTVETYRSHFEIFSRVFSAINISIMNTGYIIFSTVPLDILDLDSIVASDSEYSWVRYLILVVGLFLSLVTSLVPPHVVLINVALCLSGLYQDNEKSYFWNRFTFKVAAWYIIYICCLAIICTYMCLVSADVIQMTSGIVEVMSTWSCYPVGNRFLYMWLTGAIYFWAGSAVFIAYWTYQRNLYFSSQYEKGAGPTLLVYIAIYGWNTIFGLGLLFGGPWLIGIAVKDGTSRYDCTGFGLSCLALSAGLLTPPAIVAIVSRKRLFNFMTRRFENDVSTLEQDGSFIAGLLDKVEIKVGQAWWIHRATENAGYPQDDHNRFWIKGTVVEVDKNRFAVALQGERHVKKRNAVGDQRAELDSRQDPWKWVEMGLVLDPGELLSEAKNKLRLVEYKTIMEAKLFFNGSVRDQNQESVNHYARPRYPGEEIDFFISHSWHDDAEQKTEKLRQFAESFYEKHNRFPTFWLDKCCIDQNNIGSGLKVLPINIMACKQMLVLCGETYSRRLWCIWELCTLFLFTHEEGVLSRICVLPVQKNQDTLVMERLQEFHISIARCYDPNEEAKLLKVIDAVGLDKFHEQVHKLARAFLQGKR
eukprot:755126-Hanusia_phi.AAC.2